MSTYSPFNKLKPPYPEERRTLFFGIGNAKLEGTATFSLPAGYTCPGAEKCLAWFDRKEKRLVDGPKSEHRCFAASMEAYTPTLRASVDRNLAILQEARTTERMTNIIDLSLPAAWLHNVRVHVDGDFYHQDYFLAWMAAARSNPNRWFYAYTKSLPIWIAHRKKVPKNFVLTASWGGKWDSLIEPNKLRSARIVFHPDEAERLGLEIDHDDSHARADDGHDFALLLHGAQKAGSTGSDAIKRLKRENVQFSYNKNKSTTLKR